MRFFSSRPSPKHLAFSRLVHVPPRNHMEAFTIPVFHAIMIIQHYLYTHIPRQLDAG